LIFGISGASGFSSIAGTVNLRILFHHPAVSQGNFGKHYSRDMKYAAPRYTEVKLDKICEELFKDIDKDTVDFVDNYDGTMKEPKLLPATFPPFW